MQESCGNCRFFVAGDGDFNGASNHRCRRYPRLPVVKNRLFRKPQVTWEFSIVLRADLCGEWQGVREQETAEEVK